MSKISPLIFWIVSLVVLEVIFWQVRNILWLFVPIILVVIVWFRLYGRRENWYRNILLSLVGTAGCGVILGPITAISAFAGQSLLVTGIGVLIAGVFFVKYRRVFKLDTAESRDGIVVPLLMVPMLFLGISGANMLVASIGQQERFDVERQAIPDQMYKVGQINVEPGMEGLAVEAQLEGELAGYYKIKGFTAAEFQGEETIGTTGSKICEGPFAPQEGTYDQPPKLHWEIKWRRVFGCVSRVGDRFVVREIHVNVWHGSSNQNNSHVYALPEPIEFANTEDGITIKEMTSGQKIVSYSYSEWGGGY